jgi:hypothetical protein
MNNENTLTLTLAISTVALLSTVLAIVFSISENISATL